MKSTAFKPLRIVFGIIGLLILSALFGIVYLLIAIRDVPMSSAVSPDGTWSVAVEGAGRMNGAYEIVVRVRDAQGNPAPVNGGFVIGMTRKPAVEAPTYAVTFLDSETAVVGAERTIHKAKCFPPPP